MRGKDAQSHGKTVDASSAYEAVEQVIQAWAKLWWFDPKAVMTVRRGEESWRISQERVRAWRAAKGRRLIH